VVQVAGQQVSMLRGGLPQRPRERAPCGATAGEEATSAWGTNASRGHASARRDAPPRRRRTHHPSSASRRAVRSFHAPPTSSPVAPDAKVAIPRVGPFRNFCRMFFTSLTILYKYAHEGREGSRSPATGPCSDSQKSRREDSRGHSRVRRPEGEPEQPQRSGVA